MKDYAKYTFPPAVKMQQHMQNVFYHGSLLETQHPRFLLVTNYINALPSSYQNARLPEGRQVFSINHIACAASLFPVCYSNQLTVDWEYSKSQDLKMSANSQLYKHVLLWRAISGLPY